MVEQPQNTKETEPVSLFYTDEQWTSVLLDECSNTFGISTATPIFPGLVSIPAHATRHVDAACIAFSKQCLPDAFAITQNSINLLAKTAYEQLQKYDRTTIKRWNLHIWPMPHENNKAGPRRCQLIHDSVLQLLKKKNRSIKKKLYQTDTPQIRVTDSQAALMQILLISPVHAYFSVVTDIHAHPLQCCLSPFPAGIVPIPDDPKPPARAFKKLIEAQLVSGLFIKAGETCVDLGAAPGSWSHVAIQQGASVIAVDRSPLEYKHNNLQFIQSNGFTFKPKQPPVDWLLCDIIAYPQKSLTLLQQWLENGWCKNFCMTIKFQGNTEYHHIEAAKEMLTRFCRNGIIRRLHHNKNEVTIIGNNKNL